MRTRRQVPLLLLGALVFIGLTAISAIAASNTVPSSRLDDDSVAIRANDIKPADCSSINLTNIVVAGNGTAANDLILGTDGDDNLRGDDGDDCIVGGGGNDTLRGQKGDDILLGQDGDDTLHGNQDYDICDGGNGSDSGHNSCEVELNIP